MICLLIVIGLILKFSSGFGLLEGLVMVWLLVCVVLLM